jgi:hypothetical protein
MYSLTICFGPVGTTWAFLFKEKEKAEIAYRIVRDMTNPTDPGGCIEDDFGQNAIFTSAPHGCVLEDLDLTNEAKIIRSLDHARSETKARQRAATDPTIRAGMQQQSASVLTPFPRN